MNPAVSLIRRLTCRNVGAYDRPARLLIGTALVVGGLITTPWLVVFGLWVVLTGLVGWYPLYRLLGFSTCPLKPLRP